MREIAWGLVLCDITVSGDDRPWTNKRTRSKKKTSQNCFFLVALLQRQESGRGRAWPRLRSKRESSLEDSSTTREATSRTECRKPPSPRLPPAAADAAASSPAPAGHHASLLRL
jgi:hypothetical protein